MAVATLVIGLSWAFTLLLGVAATLVVPSEEPIAIRVTWPEHGFVLLIGHRRNFCRRIDF